MILQPGDLVYVSYPKKREEMNKPSILHDQDWSDVERQQQQVWRRRYQENTPPDLNITNTVKQITKTGKKLRIDLDHGEIHHATEHGESQPGFLIGKIDSNEDGA